MADPTQQIRGGNTGGASLARFDMKLEVVVIPVADVDRAREFYKKLGWRLDVTPPTVVQLTPPGSACSVQFGKALTSAAPGSAKIVSDRFRHRGGSRKTGGRGYRGRRVLSLRARGPSRWPRS